MKIQEKSKFLEYSTKRYLHKRPKTKWDGIPAFLKYYEPEFSLFKYFVMSTAGHIAGFIILGILFAVLQIWVVNPIIHKDKIKDIEFTIKTDQKTAPIKNYNAIPETAQNPLAETKSNSSSAPKNNIKSAKTANSTKIKPKISKTAIGDFAIPIPSIKPLSGSRGGISRRAGGSSSGSSHGSSSSPFLDDDATSANGGSSARGNGFDKNATRKVVSTYDIGPYVSELKRNIRWNWKSPKETGKTVELFLRIAKDGKVFILNVKRTSEIGAVDDAALNAVRKTMPLNPLPSQYKKGYLDIIFTFNSNSSSLGSRF